MDKNVKQKVIRRKILRNARKAMARIERVDLLTAVFDKHFSTRQFPTQEARRSGMMSLLEAAVHRLLFESVETMTPCPDEYCLDVVAACHILPKKGHAVTGDPVS